ncbi:MAG: sensor histidine kinase [Thermoleophilia bacterium]
MPTHDVKTRVAAAFSLRRRSDPREDGPDFAAPGAPAALAPLDSGGSRSSLPGARLRLLIDRDDAIVSAEGSGWNLWGLDRPRSRDSARVLLGQISPTIVEMLPHSEQHVRPPHARFLAVRGSSRVLCSATLSTPGPDGERLLDIAVDELLDIAPTGLLAYCAELEENARVAREILSALDRGSDLKTKAQTFLPLLVGALGMTAGAVFLPRGETKADFLAAYGATHQRGHPYDALDLTDARLAPLRYDADFIELHKGASIQPAIAAVLARSYSYAVLACAAVDHENVAYIVLSGRRKTALSLQEVGLLATVRQALGPTVRNHLLSDESLRNAALRDSSQAVFRAISHSLDLEETFREIVTNAAGAVGASHCLLLQKIAEDDALTVAAASDPEASRLMGLSVRFEGGMPLSDQIGKVRNLTVDDIVPGVRVSPEISRLLDFRSALWVPVSTQSRLMGSLVFYSMGRRKRYSAADMTRASDIAAQAAIAIHNAHLYQDLVHSRERVRTLLSRLSSIREGERKRIATVIHDDIVQAIVGATYLLEAFRLSSRTEEVVTEAIELMRETVADARRVIWELRPPVLEEITLEESLVTLARHLDPVGVIVPEITCDIRPMPPLPVDTSAVVYKIAREALLNAVRHAGPQRIEMSLTTDDSAANTEIHLTVRDNGVGFDATQMGKDFHYGLSMMEEQAIMVGGAVAILSEVGKGTAVEVRIPWHPATEAQPS